MSRTTSSGVASTRPTPSKLDGDEAVASEPVVDVLLAAHAVVRLALRGARHVAPPARHAAEHGRRTAVAGRVGEGGGQRRQPVGVVAGERLGEGVDPVAVEERRVGVAGEERRMAKHADEQVAVGDDAVDARPGE